MDSSFKDAEQFKQLRHIAEAKFAKNNVVEFDRIFAEEINFKHEYQVHLLELELQNQQLQESQEKLESALSLYYELYDSAIQGYFTLDRNSIIELTNLMGASFFDLPKEEIIGKKFTHLIKDIKQRRFFESFLKKVFDTDKKLTCEIAIYKKNQKPIILQITAQTFRDGQECRAVIQNITEKVEMEKQLKENQLLFTQGIRVNSIGELTPAIVHEINQPLTVIYNYITGCVNHLKDGTCNISEILDIMQTVAKQVELIGKIVHHMKNILRHDQNNYKKFEINKLVEAAVLQFKNERLVDPSISFKLQLGSDLPMINVDHVQIELVILNLLKNGLDAIQKRKVKTPRLTVRTECENNRVLVSVINNGLAYTPKEKVRLFEPFFTTKEGGMGIGLTISRIIIEAHSGFITTYKIPREGVCFQFSLPT